jgi:filamentous hemagglutinin family protein
MNYSSAKRFYLKLLLYLAFESLISGYIDPAIAQIIPDTTLPTNTNIRVNNNTSIIEGGTRVEGNLFHSLREFSVINGNEAFFNNPLDIRNIITRVTGQSISNIDGIIKANGSANLFLINPNGIIFGENARLDIGGSFVGSTANSLVFDNGWEYSATNPNSPPLLTVNVPVGLQFGRNPGAIEVRGSGHELTYDPQLATTIQDNVPALTLQTGKTFALVGGDIFFKGGNVNAESGKIFLGSVISPDLVSLKINDTDLAFEYSGVEKFGNIELSQKASVDVSGEGGGSIQIQSQGLSIKDGASVLSITAGSQPGRDITVNTSELVELIGESADGNYASSIFTESQGAGSSGNLIVNTQRLTATGGAYLSTYIGSSGNAGELTVTAPQAIELSDEGIYRSGFYTGASPLSSGSAGNLNIKTGRLSIKNRATVNSDTRGEGSAGEININTDEMIALDGGTVSASTFAEGQGGNININSTRTLQLIGISIDGRSRSGLLAVAFPRASGKAGDITIQTGELLVSNGAEVSAKTFSPANAGKLTVSATNKVELVGVSPRNNDFDNFDVSGLFTDTGSGQNGAGGDIIINTPLLRILGGAEVSATTFGAGRGGDLNIDAGNGRVEVIDTSSKGSPSRILAQSNSNSTGASGNLTISTGELIVRDGGQVAASTFGAGQGGNMTINATSSVKLSGTNPIDGFFNSGLYVQQGRNGPAGTGNAGTLTLNTPLLQVLDLAAISAGTRGPGRGGNLNITTDQLFVRNSQIRARSLWTGTGGNININVKNSIHLENNALITTNTRRNGADQATINITSADLILRRGSNITTNANSSADLIQRRGDNINTNVNASDVLGGNINIKTDNLALLERSNITANSTDARGGKINIQTQGLFQSPDSAVTARGATQTLSGTVNISSTLNPNSLLKEIPINLVDLNRQISSSCVPGTAQNRNAFTVTGRGGIPANSTELLQDTSTMAMWVTRKPKAESDRPTTQQSTVQQSSVQPNSIPQIIEATDLLVDSRGQVHLVATNRASYIPPKANVCPN